MATINVLPEKVQEKVVALFRLGLSFGLGGIACSCATVATNPIDVIKVRLQLDGELAKRGTGARKYHGMINCGSTIVREEGVRALYSGLSAAILRAASYSSIRLGAYEPLKEAFGGANTLSTKLGAGIIAGAVASFVANPIELIKVRLQAQGTPGSASHKYTGTFNAFQVILREEGFKSFYKGVGAHMQRAGLLTASQLGSYDYCKQMLLQTGVFADNMLCHMGASMVAGLITTTVSSPMDVIKTRLMNESGGSKYSGTFDCMFKIVKSEGVRGLFKGWLPNYGRLGPHTLLTLVIYEQLRVLFGMKGI